MLRTLGNINAQLAAPYSEEPEIGAAVTEGEKAPAFTVIIRIGTKP